jgi:fructose-1,6-bisphosphatase/sedoheptulose 1,7-bisphosphatase-like protein
MGNAVSVLAVAPRGAMFDLSAVSYMDQLDRRVGTRTLSAT